MWFSENNFNVNGKTALLIGGSQGIGVNLATILYKSNCSVILVARTESKLQSQVEKIESNIDSSNSAKVSYIKCDVSDYTSCIKLWQELNLQGYDPDYIFCCAGSSIPKLFKDLDEHDFKLGSSTNYDTALNVIHTGFKQQLKLEDKFTKRRSIILFSSVVSFFPFIGYSQYAPMKSAIQSLSIILRQELLNYNYRVACVFPGNFQSEGFDQEQLTKPEITKKIEGPSNPISGDKCAKLILDQLSKGYDTITTDLIGWVLGCSTLGMLPRQWGLFQIIMSFIFSIIQPIIDYFINKDIKSA